MQQRVDGQRGGVGQVQRVAIGRRAAHLAEEIAHQLSELDAENAEAFAKNLATFSEGIEQLEASLAELDAALKNRHSHRALAAAQMRERLREAWALG